MQTFARYVAKIRMDMVSHILIYECLNESLEVGGQIHTMSRAEVSSQWAVCRLMRARPACPPATRSQWLPGVLCVYC